MNTGDVIYESGIYKVQFIKNIAEPGRIEVNGKLHSVSGHKGFEFHLLKNGLFFKSYSIATGYPYNYELMKSTVIGIFKPLMK